MNDNSNDDVIDNVNDDDVARCFLCNETGHWSSECPNPSKKKALSLSGSSMKRTGVCYNCNQVSDKLIKKLIIFFKHF